MNGIKTNEELVAEYNKYKNEDILEEILKKNKPFVNKVARTCMPRERADLSYEDLIQVGFTALIDAVEGFDTEQTYSKFLSYAGNLITWRIKREIGKINKQANGMAVNSVHEIFKMNKRKEFLTVMYGKEPSNVELAHSLEISVEKLEKLIEMDKNSHTSSLNDLIYTNDDEVEMIHFLDSEDWENSYDNVELKLDIKNCLKLLTESEKKYLELYLKDYNNREITEILNVSSQRGHQIKFSIFDKVKKQLEYYM